MHNVNIYKVSIYLYGIIFTLTTIVYFVTAVDYECFNDNSQSVTKFCGNKIPQLNFTSISIKECMRIGNRINWPFIYMCKL